MLRRHKQSKPGMPGISQVKKHSTRYLVITNELGLLSLHAGAPLLFLFNDIINGLTGGLLK
jgi:hypothetical protein